MTTRKSVRRMRERCKKRDNCSTGPHLHMVTWAIVILFFVPITHRGGKQRNQMASVFDAGQKVISGTTAECESRLESNLGAQESKLFNNQWSGGHRRFLSHRRGLYLSPRQEVQETQQPEVKYDFSSHNPSDVCTVHEFEYQEQSNNDNNVKGRLRRHLDFGNRLGRMKILATRFIMVIGFLSPRYLLHFFFFFFQK